VQAIAKSRLTRKKMMLCICGGTERESFTMSCYRPIKQLTVPNSTVNNCRDYNKQLRGSDQN